MNPNRLTKQLTELEQRPVNLPPVWRRKRKHRMLYVLSMPSHQPHHNKHKQDNDW
jgi:hypothetical protein